MNHIRKMLPQDAFAVATVHTLAWQHAYKGILDSKFLDSISVEKRAENWKNGVEKNDPDILRLVCLDGDEIVGFVCGLNNRDTDLLPSSDGELWAIYVHPEKMHSGIGAQLFQDFTSRLKKLNFKRMGVWALKDNIIARRFYERNGGILSQTEKQVTIGEQKVTEVAYEFDL